jgi:hypothetical protein
MLFDFFVNILDNRLIKYIFMELYIVLIYNFIYGDKKDRG